MAAKRVLLIALLVVCVAVLATAAPETPNKPASAKAADSAASAFARLAPKPKLARHLLLADTAAVLTGPAAGRFLREVTPPSKPSAARGVDSASAAFARLAGDKKP